MLCTTAWLYGGQGNAYVSRAPAPDSVTTYLRRRPTMWNEIPRGPRFTLRLRTNGTIASGRFRKRFAPVVQTGRTRANPIVSGRTAFAPNGISSDLAATPARTAPKANGWQRFGLPFTRVGRSIFIYRIRVRRRNVNGSTAGNVTSRKRVRKRRQDLANHNAGTAPQSFVKYRETAVKPVCWNHSERLLETNDAAETRTTAEHRKAAVKSKPNSVFRSTETRFLPSKTRVRRLRHRVCRRNIKLRTRRDPNGIVLSQIPSE